MAPTTPNIVVTKRDGTKEPYDVIKIKKSIEMATEGTGVSPLLLESNMDLVIKNNIRTQDIQENIIHHAKQFATSSEPEWLQVAGRAKAMDMWASFKLKGKSFLEIVKYNVKKKEYSASLLEYYTDDMIDEIGKFIDYQRDLAHSISSLITVSKKYLGKYELNQHMHAVSAMRFGQFEPEETRVQFVKEVYDVLSNRELSIATPFMSNLRKGGNVASCFIIAVEDDLDSIFDNVKRIAKISKNGGGVGCFLGFLRAKGSDVNGYSNAAGTVTQWVKIINDTAVAVNQGGKRKGAVTVALPVWHNDILDFLDMQTERGDLRLKSYDIFPQLTVPDIFMERDEAQGRWITFCPFEVKQKLGIDVRGLHDKAFTEAYLKIEAAYDEGKLNVAQEFPNVRTLTKTAMRSMFETGLPYVFFSDTANRTNPNKNDIGAYGILCANLCTESFSNVIPDKLSHVCNLASINLANIHSMERLAEVARLATKILDYGISLTNNPDPTTKAHNDRYRTIGIGIMGLHDYLAREFRSYADLDHIGEIAECIEYNAVMASIELSKKYGAFEAYEYSEWKNGNMTKHFASLGCGKFEWEHAQELIDQFGIRNSQLTSPAPTTSTSIYQDASATFQPVYSPFFTDDNSNGALKVSSKYLSLNPMGYGKTQAKFKAKEIIDIAMKIQNHTDTGVSMELMFDQNDPTFTAKDLYDAIHYAHKKKAKAIYYIRTIKKNEKLEKGEEACVACAG